MKGIYFVVPVWGQAFVKLWLRYGLPSVMSPRNLPALAKQCRVKILYCTTQEDLPLLLSSPLTKAARDVGISIRPVILAQTAAEVTKLHNYNAMNVCHNHALDLAWKDDHGLMFGMSDLIYADGCMEEVGRAVAAGKRGVLTQTFEVLNTEIDRLLAAHGVAPRHGDALMIPPRTLVQIGCAGATRMTEAWIWGQERYTLHPAIMLWRLGPHGFLLRSWHLYPFFLYPERKSHIVTTCDGDLIGQAVDLKDCVVADDSDRLFFFSLSKPDKLNFVPTFPWPSHPPTVAAWLRENTRPFNREVIQHKIWIHDGVDRNDWRETERSTDEIIAEILDHYERQTGASTPSQTGSVAPLPSRDEPMVAPQTHITSELLRDPVRAEQMLREIEPLATVRPDVAFEFCLRIAYENPVLVAAYVLGGKAALRLGDAEKLTRFLMLGRNAGHEHLVKKGKLDEGRAFFRAMAQTFPDPYHPYALLFDQIAELSATYRIMRRQLPPARRRLLVAITVWGERHCELLTRYAIPSMLAPGNLPTVAGSREVHFDIYTTGKDAEAIRRTAAFQKLATLAAVHFTTFSDELLSSTEYRRGTDLRYWIFGGFHHVAIEHARALDADIMPSMPDCAFSNGSLATYVRAVDEGYDTALSFSIRTQAEGVRPALDELRDEAAQTLILPSRMAVELSVLNVHHAYKRFFVTKDNRRVPHGPPVLMFPHDHGFYARCLHMHPMILSARIIRKDVNFDYFTIDSNALASFFATPEDLEKMKIIQDSDAAAFIEISHSFHEVQPEHVVEGRFSLGLLAIDGYLPHHFRNFRHRINFHCDAQIDAFGTYERLADGTLRREFAPKAVWTDFRDDEVASWLLAERERLLKSQADTRFCDGSAPAQRPIPTRASDHPTISILITTYNRRPLLERALASIRKQDFDDYELVVIDDASSDDTESVMRVRATEDPRIRYCRNHRNMGGAGGDMATIKRFLKEFCRGTYWIYLCDDDYWLPDDLLSRQVAAMRAHPSLSMVQGGMVHVFPREIQLPRPNNPAIGHAHVNGDRRTMFYRCVFPNGFLSGERYLDLLASDPKNRNIIIGATLFDTEKFKSSGAFDNAEGVRWQAGYAILAGAATQGDVFYLDEPCIMTAVTADSASHRGTQRQHLEDCLCSVDAAFGAKWPPVRHKLARGILKMYLGNKVGYRVGALANTAGLGDISHVAAQEITPEQFFQAAAKHRVELGDGERELISLSNLPGEALATKRAQQRFFELVNSEVV